MYYHYDMRESRRKPNVSIRINPEVVHQAKVAAVSSKKTLGKWLEEAILEKIDKEKGG
jgi:predicted HicB family RNase H-like nuclease